MDDLIIRQAAIEYFQRIIDSTNTDGRYNLGFIDGLEFCINHLSTMEAVQPEQKKGKWIEDGTHSVVICSQCDASNLWKSPCCPYCGAKMDER